MGDFNELKKRVESFLVEAKGFASEVKNSDDSETQQQRYIELRSQKNEITKEVKDFEPAKKILLLDSKKSKLIKSLNDELIKAEKAMSKQKIEVPKDEQNEEEEKSSDKKGKKKGGDDEDEGKDKVKGDRSAGSKKDKPRKENKKGKHKVEVVDDDRKSTSSAKVKQSEKMDEEGDNDFEDTEEEDDRDENDDAEEGDEEEEEVEDDDKVRAASKGKEGTKANRDEKKSDDKKGSKAKDKKKATKKGKDSKKDGKKSRKDSEKSVTDGKDSQKSEERDEVEDVKVKKRESGKSKGVKDDDEDEEAEQNRKDQKKSSKSKKGKKDKKEEAQESKKSKKEKISKKEGKEAKKANDEEDEDEEEEKDDEEIDKPDAKKEKRKSKEIKESKGDKSKSKDADNEEDRKNMKDTKKKEKKNAEDGKDKEDKISKSENQPKEGKKSKVTDDRKAEEVTEAVMIHHESKQRTAVAGPSLGAGAAAVQMEDDDDYESEYEEETENFQEETEDEEETDEKVVAKQAARVQQSAASAVPTPAPRQKVVEGPTTTAAMQAPAQLEEDDADYDDDEEEEDEESEYDYENMRTLGPNEPSTYEVLCEYSNEDTDILNIQKGEQLRVLKVGPDGWWLGRNAQGREGLVPGNMLRLVLDDESEGSELDEVTQADTTVASGGPDDLSRTGPTEGDESEDEADDLTPGDRVDEAVMSADLSLSQRMVTETQPTPPGMPAGFRVSSLAKWFYEGTKKYPGRQFTLQSLLQPKLTASCMSLQDSWGCSPQIRPVPSRIEKLVLLQKCLMMSSGLPVTVLDRFVRICLFDGHGPVSNVHTVRATVSKDDRVWLFGSRATDAGSALEYGEAYLRYNHVSNHVRLLLEATIVCQSETTGAEAMELSIGHAAVPLFDGNGSPMPAKAFDLQFEGGTPFDQQHKVDTSLGQSGSGARSQPRIQLKISVPNKETKDFMDTCPTTVLGNLANLQLHSLYRHVLASELIHSNRVLEQCSRPIYAPHLVQFPAMADQPDLMDVMRRRWNEFAKRDRAFRKPITSEVMKQEFIRIVKSTYFLNQLKTFQPYVFGHKAQEQLRASSIQDFLRKIATDPNAVNFSLSADLAFEPFSMDEVALPMIGQFSMPVLPVAVE